MLALASSRRAHTLSLETHGTGSDDAGTARLTAVGGHRAPRLEEGNARHGGGRGGHAHAGRIGVGLLTDETRSADRRRNKEIAAARAAHAGDTPACRRARQALTARARWAGPPTGAGSVAPARPDAEGSRPWTARQCPFGTQADADVDARSVHARIVRAAVPIVAVSVRLTHLTGQSGSRRARRRRWRTTRRTELVRERARLRR